MESNNHTHIDTALCPLCGKPNHCIMATCSHDKNGPCWCRDLHIPRALLEQVPDHAQRRACICKECIEKYSR